VLIEIVIRSIRFPPHRGDSRTLDDKDSRQVIGHR
jgi:hypothetical protein